MMLFNVEVFVNGKFKGWYRSKKTLTRKPQKNRIYAEDQREPILQDLREIYNTDDIKIELVERDTYDPIKFVNRF